MTRGLSLKELRHLVRCIDCVTRHVERCHRRYRSALYRPPWSVIAAARAVRDDVDVAALRVVLDWLEGDAPNPPVKVGAAVWDLGGRVYVLLQRQEAELRELWRRTAA